ncbi:MAG: phosphoglucosamine mutase [Actinobacteria bacterium]|nr:phosphoglucosamine mutase [Actinomycetota bacterium]MCB9389834.1 phosphoglucosamine mutase [Acidimicrobiia bacterium]
MAVSFGTDGIRGVANGDVDVDVAVRLGRAAARCLGIDRPFYVGRDTRRSGPMLQAALSAGMASAGADVVDLGVIPTPGVAVACASRHAPGAVVSASHNPFADNGIKFFAAGGLKLTDAQQDGIEAELAAPHGDLPTGAGVGRIDTDRSIAADYVAHLCSAVAPGSLRGLRIVLDVGNGAASEFARPVFERAGADVIVLNDEPDGVNINARCGSTDVTGLAETVASRGASLGFAFDGDADRVICVGPDGSEIDGDALIFLLANSLDRRSALTPRTVAVTVMSNLGLHKALADRGIARVVTPVGDRHLLAAVADQGLKLAGEQSGHLIVADLSTTGDGLLSALLVAQEVALLGEPVNQLVSPVVMQPQVLINVPVPLGASYGDAALFAASVAEAEERLGTDGRVLVRPSGTEPKVRIMVEAADDATAAEVAGQLSDKLAEELKVLAAAPE